MSFNISASAASRLVLSLPLLFAMPLTAKAACPPSSPEMHIESRQPELTIATDYSLIDINGPAPKPGTAAATRPVAFGKYETKPNHRVVVSFSESKAPEGGYCVSVRRVDIELAYINNVVQVASDVPRGGCVYQQIMRYQSKRYKVDSEVLRNWKNVFPALLAKQLAGSKGTVQSNDIDSAHAYLRAAVSSVVHQQFDRMNADREARQLQFEEKEDYGRIHLTCEGAGRDLQLQYLNEK